MIILIVFFIFLNPLAKALPESIIIDKVYKGAANACHVVIDSGALEQDPMVMRGGICKGT